MGFRPFGPLMFCVLAIACLAAAAAAFAQDAPAPKRLALVIGNSAYRADPLPTAANDAGLVAEALAQDGFDVTAVADADAPTLRKALDLFVADVRAAGGTPLVFVYVSGHGVQYAERNYVVPVDATIERHAEVPEKAVPFSEILKPLGAVPASARLFVFDLAHPNTIAKGEPIPLAAGLRHMQPPPGSVYAANAAPGMLGRPDAPFYGTYARALTEALRTPGLNVQGLFSRVRARVAEITAGAVVPWSDGELEPDVMLLAARGHAPVGQIATRAMSGLPVQTVYWAAIAEDTLAGYQAFLRAFPADPLSKRVETIKAVRLEAVTWAEACRADKPEAYWTYMIRYPRGPHYVDVRRRLAALHAALEPPMRFDPAELAGWPTPTPDEVNISAKAAATFEDFAWPPTPPAPAELLPPPSPAIFAELAPPPFVPTGALPVAAPLPDEASHAPIGRIVQPLAAPGPLTIDAEATDDNGVVVTLVSDDGLITRTKTRLDTGRRTIVQTDAADEIVSWTTVGGTGDDVAITQSGPGGAILSKQIVRGRSDGALETILTTGSDRLIAETKSDKRGHVSAVTLGTAKAPEPTFFLAAPEPRPAPERPPATTPADPAPSPPQEPKNQLSPTTEKQPPSLPLGADAGRGEGPPAPSGPAAILERKDDAISLRGESSEPPAKNTATSEAPAPQPPSAAATPPADASSSVAAHATPMAATPSGASDTTATATPATPVPVRKPAAAAPPRRPLAQHLKRRPLVFQRGRQLQKGRPATVRRAVRR